MKIIVPIKAVGLALLLCSCDKTSSSPTTTGTQNKETSPMSQPQLPSDQKAKLQAIYDTAPGRRASVDKAVSGSSDPVRVNNNTEAPRLEAILKSAGWSSSTVTEGVKESVEDGFVWKLEVIDGAAQDWFVLMKTDKSIATGTVQSKSKNSPW
jgi:hypothetical protein